MLRYRLLPMFLALCIPLTTHPALATSPPAYFTHRFTVGEHYSDVLSYMTAYRGAGFTESVRRNGGSYDYAVTSVGRGKGTIRHSYRYDGYRAGDESQQIDTATLAQVRLLDTTPVPIDDASGLAFNPFLWGRPPAHLAVGTRWKVSIARPWEIGPAGTKEVRVVSLQPETGTVTLARTGQGAGPFESDTHNHGAKITID